MRQRSHHKVFEPSRGNTTTDSERPALTLAGTGHQEPPKGPKSCHWRRDIWQDLEPVMEPYAQTKVGHHFVETKSDRLVLPETAYITVRLKCSTDSSVERSKEHGRLESCFSLSDTQLILLVTQDCYSVCFCKMRSKFE